MLNLIGSCNPLCSESIGGVGDLEITPVSAAIARHLGIDLTPEARAARNRRGIAIIVHGPPISGNLLDFNFQHRYFEETVISLFWIKSVMC